MLFIGIGLWVIGFGGILIIGFLSIISYFRKRAYLGYLKAVGGMIIVTVIGIALMTFAEDNYWERQEMSKSQERENKQIEKRILENIQAEEEAFQKALEEQQKDLATWSQEQHLSSANQTNTYELDPMDEQGVYNAFINYKNVLISAMNNGDFLILEPLLSPNSSFYFSQKALIDDGIVEHLNFYNIEFIYQVNDNEFEVATYEEVDIESAEDEGVKMSQWIYTVEKVNGHYLLSDRKSR